MDRIFPLVYQEQKKKEFINLLQRTMTVAKYETQFTALSRFAKEMVSDKAIKYRKFKSGLIPAIVEMLVVHAYTDYQKLVDGALRTEKQLAETKKIKAVRSGSVGGTSSSQTHQTQTQSQISQQQQQSKRRTWNNVVSSGGAQPSRAPQSSATIPGQSSGGQRDITCYNCGRQGHTARMCRSARPTT